jgi:pyruvate kinase
LLRSLQDSPRPTRVEVTDVATAVVDGTDAVMLSVETAIGRFPLVAVTMMAGIGADAESTFPFDAWMHGHETAGPPPEAVARAACRLADDIEATAIITCTQSGGTARRVARHRPRSPILAPTPHVETYRRLALVWGVTPLLNPSPATTDALIDEALSVARATGRARPGDTVVVTAGLPVGRPGLTNLIKVETL